MRQNTEIPAKMPKRAHQFAEKYEKTYGEKLSKTTKTSIKQIQKQAQTQDKKAVITGKSYGNKVEIK